MKATFKQLRDAFWADPPTLPAGLALERREPIVVTRSGRGGTAIYDLIDLNTPTGRVLLVAAYQERLLAGQVDRLKERLSALAVQRRLKHDAEGLRPTPDAAPTIITDVAKPSVIEACRRSGVAVVDRRGTIIVSVPPLFVHVVGKGHVERPWRGRLFSGKASRIVRFLLTAMAPESPPVPRSTRLVANACELSYVYAYGVLTKLEREGFVERPSPHGGFRLKNPLGLLKAWISSGEEAACEAQGFYCPATSRQAMVAAAKKLKDATDNVPLFTLASALDPDEIHVTALPHAVYWTGELNSVVHAFGLKRTTPHNFRVLLPDPLLWTTAGGLLQKDSIRPDPVDTDVFRRVALPQLIVDFAASQGRGREQAEFLLGIYAKNLPYSDDEP